MSAITQIDRDGVLSILEMYAITTGNPVILWNGTEGIMPPAARQKMQPYCTMIQSFPLGRQLCANDHKRRADLATKEGFDVCHAGLYNYQMPIWVREKWMGTLLCGQVRLSDPDYVPRALARHKSVVNELGLRAGDMKALYEQAPELDLLGCDRLFVDQLRSVQRVFFGILDSSWNVRQERDEFGRGQDNIAHEFQVRLQGLMGYAGLLQYLLVPNAQVTDQIIDDVNEVVRAVERLNVLVHNLRMGLGAYEFRFCSLRTIVDEAVALYRREADRRFIDFEVSMTGKSAVECSQRHAQHMMNNLVANAVKYSYRGSPEQSRYIEIRGINRRQAYEVAISNYGIGILPEEMSQIFEKGYRGVLTRDESRTGAGLGLAIAKEIADEHSGSISPESIEFEGAFKTTFTLRLPILRPKGGEE